MIRKPKKAPAVPPAALAGLQMVADGEGFTDKPLGGGGGEMLPTGPAQPPAVLEPPRIDPPPWQDELSGNLDLTGLSGLDEKATVQPRDALAELKEANGETWEPPPWGPPVVTPPLQRPKVPEADWEAEEAARQERERAEAERNRREQRAQLLQELLDEDTDPYPRRKSP